MRDSVAAVLEEYHDGKSEPKRSPSSYAPELVFLRQGKVKLAGAPCRQPQLLLPQARVGRTQPTWSMLIPRIGGLVVTCAWL
jgi:hypothetical protein